MKAPSVLVLRLSSLGDLILSTAFLENLPPQAQVDWVVGSQFAFALEGHPRIRNLYRYDKKTGLVGWLQLMRQLARQRYDVRVDLHGTLRSFLARLVFRLAGQPMLRISKQRLRTLLYFTMKRFLPRSLRPTPYWERFSELAHRARGGSAVHLQPPRFPLAGEDASVLATYSLQPKRYLAVMPSSRWSSKEWGSARYFEAIQALRALDPAWAQLPILVCGRETDRASVELLQRLQEAQVPTRSGLAEQSFSRTAMLLANALVYVGGDTGLAHLAEAVGTPAVVVFGPTQPDVGFGPWNERSRAVRSTVLCSPCSKDGRPCYRLGQPYECFRRIQPAQVAGEIAKVLRREGSAL